jgi:hypothetical protein
MGFRCRACPTAREALGRPIRRANPPYVMTRPGGIRLVVDRTRRLKGVIPKRSQRGRAKGRTAKAFRTALRMATGTRDGRAAFASGQVRPKRFMTRVRVGSGRVMAFNPREDQRQAKVPQDVRKVPTFKKLLFTKGYTGFMGFLIPFINRSEPCSPPCVTLCFKPSVSSFSG